MSYKKAWTLIDAVNRSSPEPVTINTVGGKSGGGAALTAYGKALIETFGKINADCWVFLDQQAKQLPKGK